MNGNNMSMAEKFTLYDIIGYIIPGAIVLWVILVLFEVFSLPLFGILKEGIWGITLFIIVAYFVGQIVQTISNIFENKLMNKWGGFPSVRFLRKSDKTYSREFKDKIKKAASEYFDNPKYANCSEDKEAEDKQNQELFNLSYSTLVQKNIARHTEIFNGIYAFSRSLIVATLFSSFMFLVISIKYAFSLPTEIKSLISALLLSLLLRIMYYFSVRRFKRFGERFADSVYRNFYVYYQSLRKS